MSLEDYFEKTKDELYKGHKELEECSFDDRERQGEGPTLKRKDSIRKLC